MLWRELINTGGAKADYLVASALVSVSSLELFFQMANPVLAFGGLLIGVVIGLIRLRKQWKFRNRAPQ